MTDEEARKADLAMARSLRGELCEGCPPAKYPEAPHRCLPCPRRPTTETLRASLAETAQRSGRRG